MLLAGFGIRDAGWGFADHEHRPPAGSCKGLAANHPSSQGGHRVKKIVLVIILVAVAIWYFDLSRKMTEYRLKRNGN